MDNLYAYVYWNDPVDREKLMIHEESQDNCRLEFLEHGKRR